MRWIFSVLTVLMLEWGNPAHAQELFPLQAIGANVSVVQGEAFRDYTTEASHPFTLTTSITAGDTVLGAVQWEGDGVGTVVINGQNATVLTTIVGDGCCANVTLFAGINVPGGAAFTVNAPSGGSLNPLGSIEIIEIAGLGSGATVDAYNGNFVYNPSAGTLTSNTITPSASGDFLWGVQSMTYGTNGTLSTGSGWANGPNDTTCNNSVSCPYWDEYIAGYSSTSPIAATFNLSTAGGEAWTAIIAVKP